MRLLIDTDAFCKLGVAAVISDSLGLLETDPLECARLPALPHMLRRGRLPNVYGQASCDALIPLAESLPEVSQPDEDWLDRLALIEAIDPGEAQIFAAAAEYGLIVLTGDKRALRALKDV